jgi:hypothetical protein
MKQVGFDFRYIVVSKVMIESEAFFGNHKACGIVEFIVFGGSIIVSKSLIIDH